MFVMVDRPAKRAYNIFDGAETIGSIFYLSFSFTNWLLLVLTLSGERQSVLGNISLLMKKCSG